MTAHLIIVGAGPAGLSLARSLDNVDVNITILEKQDENTLANPAIDGRDIALTHHSLSILKKLGAHQHIPDNCLSPIKAAKVLDGDSPYTLHFDSKTNQRGINALGYLVPNHIIRLALYREVSQQANVTLMTNTVISTMSTGETGVEMTLDNGNSLHADLMVAADSRFSTTRRAMGISASMQDFGRTIIVCRVQHTIPHNNIAYECFRYGRTLAILPFTENQSSIVITVAANKADAIMTMSADDFNQKIEEEVGNTLGRITLDGERYAYPLVGVYANQFIATRFALLGDAAVGMHPVTAHGFNLGLKGQETLATLIKAALNKNNNIGSKALLEKYQSAHRRASKPIYLGTNAIVKLYTNDFLPAKLARKALLRFSNHFPPIKQSITRELTALTH